MLYHDVNSPNTPRGVLCHEFYEFKFAESMITIVKPFLFITNKNKSSKNYFWNIGACQVIPTLGLQAVCLGDGGSLVRGTLKLNCDVAVGDNST